VKRHPSIRRKTSSGFTLVEIMIVVAILGVVLSIASPTWLRQRRRAQQRACQEKLAKITGAKEQWAMEFNQHDTSTPDWDDLIGAALYIKRQPECPSNGNYSLNAMNLDPSCTINEPLDHNETT